MKNIPEFNAIQYNRKECMDIFAFFTLTIQYSDESICCLSLQASSLFEVHRQDSLCETWGQQPELHYLCIAQLMTGWRPRRKDGGVQGGRLAAHFCINLQIDSIRRETGEGGRQAAGTMRPPGQGIRHCQNCFGSGYWTSGARYEPAYHLPGRDLASPEHTGPYIWPPHFSPLRSS